MTENNESSSLSCMKEVKLRIHVHLHPSRLSSIEQGVEEILNQYLLKYNEELGGFIICYSSIKILESQGSIFYGRPHINFPVQAKFIIFAPSIGTKLRGVVNKLGEDHIALLVHNYFNVSVSGKGLPSSLSYDAATDAWRAKNHDQTIQVGSEVDFLVAGLHYADGPLSITGSLVPLKQFKSDSQLGSSSSAKTTHNKTNPSTTTPHKTKKLDSAHTTPSSTSVATPSIPSAKKSTQHKSSKTPSVKHSNSNVASKASNKTPSKPIPSTPVQKSTVESQTTKKRNRELPAKTSSSVTPNTQSKKQKKSS